jgi:hypothetical protein
LNDWNVWNDWNEPLSYEGHVIRAPEFASVSCYCQLLYLSPELLNYHPVRGRKRLPQMPQK